MTHQAELVELKRRLREISDLRGAEAVLGWDQATYMPPGGAEARGRQLALLSRLGHERLVEPTIGRLLDSLAPWAEAQGADSDAAALVRVTRRDFDRATRVPSAFIQRLSEHTAASYHAWERARPANDFAAVRPLLETTVELSRELAAYYTGYAHPFDALIDLAEDGMTVAAVRALFTELRAGLVPLIAAIRARP
jgi:carboxypeptidase Taq